MKRERAGLNPESLDSSFDSIYDGAMKGLSALTKRGNFLGTVRKVFFLDELNLRSLSLILISKRLIVWRD